MDQSTNEADRRARLAQIGVALQKLERERRAAENSGDYGTANQRQRKIADLVDERDRLKTEGTGASNS